MTKQTGPTARRKGSPYSLGSIALTLLLVLLYWWNNGAQPEVPEQAQGPTAVVTAQILATQVVDQPSGVDAPTIVVTATITSSTANPTPAATAVPTTAPTALPTATAEVPTATATAPPATATISPKATATPSTSKAPRGMATITLDELPPEARETIALIQQGGPFPYSKDGTTFQNRERLLPNQPRGYYREYTVITPGENDRGARRIIGGDNGELYYTADHYNSFAWILLP